MVDLTWLSYVISAVVLYYFALFALSLLPRRAPAAVRAPADLLYVLLVPARNEARVIGETTRSLLALEGSPHFLIVVNDGSTDETAEVLREEAARDGRVLVVDRDKARSGRGKGDSLNEGYRVLCDLVETRDPRVRGYGPDRIVVGVVDADGRLERDCLVRVSWLFSDRSVGSIQIAVEIRNAADGLLARLQDMEFVAFNAFVQVARNRFGSPGLGGNGQFCRLDALQSLGRRPWDPVSLTEDLDLGLRLIAAGWSVRFCGDTAVSQQGLTRLRPLFRQRTRWIQGHYQCWKHLPRMARATCAPWYTRLDLMTYLVLVLTVMLVFTQFALSLLAAFGVIEARNGFLDFLSPTQQTCAQLLLALLPVSTFLLVYQARSRQPLKWWELPAFGAAFTVYCYGWVLASLRAWARMAIGRWGWVKTPRLPV